MSSPPKVQWSTKVVSSKSKYTPLRPQFARHGTSEVATTARDKLDDQAGRGDHDLRLLVGHANTLDYLVERLEARKLRPREAPREPTPKTAQKRPNSQDRSLPSKPLSNIPEDPSHAISNEQTSLDGDKEAELRALVISKQSEEPSYFSTRGDKVSPGLSIVAMLDSGSDGDSSEESDADADSESDADSDDDNFESRDVLGHGLGFGLGLERGPRVLKAQC